MRKSQLLTGAGLVGLAVGSAQASIITWGLAQNVTSDVTQVLNNGTAVAAVTTYTSNLTINSVLFTAWDGSWVGLANQPNIGKVSFGVAPISLQWADSGYDNYSGEPDQYYGTAPLSTDYQRLVRFSGYGQSPVISNTGVSLGEGTITMTGLTFGLDYQVQVWAPLWSDSSDTYLIDEVQIKTGTPQYIVGTFTADGTSQTIPWSGLTDTGYSYAPAAVSLREVAVPEAASMSLLVLGGMGLRARRRRVA